MPCLKRSPRFWHLKPILAILESYRLSCCNFCNGNPFDLVQGVCVIVSVRLCSIYGSLSLCRFFFPVFGRRKRHLRGFHPNLKPSGGNDEDGTGS
uniref:Uncharacterized protein n=1 Tax=Rhizophora mucronata TaxID=61149 RepID=A0A2P2M2M3_RHIMU